MKTLTAVAAIAVACAFGAPAVHAADYPADNSGKNVRDRDGGRVTPTDQANNKADMAITRQIRRAVVADKGLSTNAHTVKIITANGVVTLRGPVKSASEKASVEEKAKQYEGKTLKGNILISVHTETGDEIDRAKEIFKREGAQDISYTGETAVKVS